MACLFSPKGAAYDISALGSRCEPGASTDTSSPLCPDDKNVICSAECNIGLGHECIRDEHGIIDRCAIPDEPEPVGDCLVRHEEWQDEVSSCLQEGTLPCYFYNEPNCSTDGSWAAVQCKGRLYSGK